MKKGRLRQVIEKAHFVKGNYRVQFRDKKRLAEVSIDDFWEIADIIPEHRCRESCSDGEVGLSVFKVRAARSSRRASHRRRAIQDVDDA